MIKKSAAILAGGKSSRMNYKNKAFLDYRGKSFIENIIDALCDYEEIIIISNTPEEYSDLGVKVIKDIYPSQGPLSGIHAALSYIRNDYCLIVACDMPFLDREIVNYLGNLEEKYEVLIPKIAGRLQPLCGIYKKSIKYKLETKILNKENRLIKSCYDFNLKVIEDLEMNIKNLERGFFNINTEEDYIRFVEG